MPSAIHVTRAAVRTYMPLFAMLAACKSWTCIATDLYCANLSATEQIASILISWVGMSMEVNAYTNSQTKLLLARSQETLGLLIIIHRRTAQGYAHATLLA